MPTEEHIPFGQMDHSQVEQCEFASGLLCARANAIADRATAVLFESAPDIAQRYRPNAFEKWRESMVARVADLSSAIGSAAPSVFAEQVAWSRVAFECRGIDHADMVRGLEALHTTVREEIPDEDRALIKSYFDAAQAAVSVCRMPSSSLDPHTPAGRIAAAYLLAALESDRLRASRIVLDEVESGRMSVRDIYSQVLTPVMAEVGRLWHINELTVGEEHIVTATTQQVVCQLYGHITRKPPNGRSVIVTTPEGNPHDIGIRMVADMFEMEGWRAVYLGTCMPPEDLARSVVDFDADLVIISVCIQAQVWRVEKMVEAIRSVRATRDARVMVGGPGFRHCADAWKQLGADAHGMSLEDALAKADQLVPPRR